MQRIDDRDIRNTAILPTLKEVESAEIGDLPCRNASNSFDSLQKLLDFHFRLFREDCVIGVRRRLKHALQIIRDTQHQETGCTNSMFKNVRIENFVRDWRKGLSLDVSFDRFTSSVDERARSRPETLPETTLVCLIDAGSPLIFCSVSPSLRVSWKTSTRGAEQRVPTRGSMLLAPESITKDAVQQLLTWFMSRHREKPVFMIAFPGVLLQTFQPVLIALQQMKSKKTLSMAQLLIQPRIRSRHQTSHQPTYTAFPGFRFNLKCLLAGDDTRDLFYVPGHSFEGQKSQNNWKLDACQLDALLYALSTRLALIQGPPGTGKSTVVKGLIHILRQARKEFPGLELGPVVVTSFTNHALDQTLENLRVDGCTKIIRLGHRSGTAMVRAWSNQMMPDPSKTTSKRLYLKELYHSKSQNLGPLFSFLHELDTDGFCGGERIPTESTAISTYVNQKADRMLDAMSEFANTQRKIKDAQHDLEVEHLQCAEVIGVTTSALASRLDLFERLRPRILICEEAGEVSEVQLLPALLSSLAHVVLIGDHHQLRPRIRSHTLSASHLTGRQYSLDCSILERLTQHLGHRTLCVQRRMHPMISRLLRQTYPTMQDARDVHLHPMVLGMEKRVFWLDHASPEVSQTTGPSGSSLLNPGEVELTAGLFRYLIRKGYKYGQIAILTPYQAQVDNLKLALLHEHHPCSRDFPLVSTIDSFQGKEADIVVLSLVRSNKHRKLGFCRSSNRVAVALSRARHGLYILGNVRTACSSRLWRETITILKMEGALGDKFPYDFADNGSIQTS